MTQTPKNGFCEIGHTADLEIKVWGQDLPSLFRQAAQGMYHLMGMDFAHERREPIPQILHTEGMDLESLLVNFLDELLYLLDVEGLAFTSLDLEMSGNTILEFRGLGLPIISRERGIKAVTYHNLEIQKTENGFEVNIVFDI